MFVVVGMSQELHDLNLSIHKYVGVYSTREKALFEADYLRQEYIHDPYVGSWDVSVEPVELDEEPIKVTDEYHGEEA